MLREAIDDVIDPMRSQRFSVLEIQADEKDYLQIKLALRFKAYFGQCAWEIHGFSDSQDGSHPKDTFEAAWSLPGIASIRPCCFIHANETSLSYSIGITTVEKLPFNKTVQVSASAFEESPRNCSWLLKDVSYPETIWKPLTPSHRATIAEQRNGGKRVAMLFRLRQRHPISRFNIAQVSEQKDYMHLLRRSGSIRNELGQDGIAVLSGRKHGTLIQKLDLPYCSRDEFISFRPENRFGRAQLVGAGIALRF